MGLLGVLLTLIKSSVAFGNNVALHLLTLFLGAA
jgi:hypothetical protein